MKSVSREKRLVLIGKGTEHEGVPGGIRVETQTEVKNEGGQIGRAHV